jgi:hypothetical protein
MPLAIVDCGMKAEIAVARKPTVSPSHASRGSEPAVRAAVHSITTGRGSTPKAPAITEASDTRTSESSTTCATETSTPAAVKATTATTAMESAPASTVEASATAAVTPTVLSQGYSWHESNTDEGSECDERSKKTKSAHNPYLHVSVGAPTSKSDSRPVQGVAQIGTRVRFNRCKASANVRSLAAISLTALFSRSLAALGIPEKESVRRFRWPDSTRVVVFGQVKPGGPAFLEFLRFVPGAH